MKSVLCNIHRLAGKAFFLHLIALGLFFSPQVYGAEFFRKQSGTTTIANGSTTTTLTAPTILSLDMSKSFLVFSSSISAADPTNFQVGGQITSSTSIEFRRTGNTGTVSISWQIFEFEGGVSVQRGSIAPLPFNTTNITINCVDVNKSFAIVTARKSGSQLGSDDGITADLTSSTNLQLITGSGGGQPEEAYWQVIEYEQAVVKKLTATLGAGSTSTTSTISPDIGNLAKALVIGNHRISGDVTAGDLPRTELTNTTTVTYTRVGTAEAMNFVTYVVEFTDQSTVVRGNQNFPSTSISQNVTIAAIASSGVFGSGNFGRQGSTSFTVSDNVGHNWFTYQITTATNLLISRATGTSGGNSSADAPWQIVTFADTGLQQNTFYSRLAGPTDWESNLAWSFTPDGSSGAVPTGLYPRRSNNVVIQTGHTIRINSVTDNGPCSTSPDGLNRTNVGPFAASNLVMFYQTGDILINGTLTVTGIEMMVEGYTKIASGGVLNLTSSFVNLGFLEADAGSTLSAADDIILAGNSATIINTTSISNDDLIISFPNATLCGTGTTTLQNGSGSVVTYANGATVAQICTSFTVACTGVGCSGFPVVGTGPSSIGNSGPGGVASTDGTSELKVWLDGNRGVTTSVSAVTLWADQSGNANNANPPLVANRPALNPAALNGFPTVTFDGTDDVLSIADNAGIDLRAWSFFLVGRVNVHKNFNAFFTKGSDALENFEFLSNSPGTGDVHFPIYYTTGARSGDSETPGGSMSNSTFGIFQYDYDRVNIRVLKNLNQIFTRAETRTPQANASALLIGNEAGTTGRNLNGRIAEFISYNSTVNLARRIIVNNYLSAKYNIALAANNVYTFDDGALTFDYEVAGIGQASDGSKHIDAKGTGAVRMWDPSSLANSEFLMWGHDNGAMTGTPSGVDGVIVQERLVRIWRVGESADVGTVSISFDLSSLASPLGSNLRLLIDRDGDGFGDNDVAPVAGSFINNTVVFSSIDFQSGDRFTLGNTDGSDPLPIELISFTAEVIQNEVLLKWATASELNNDYFTIQRSQSPEKWQDIKRIDGEVDSRVRIDYETLDTMPLQGVSYYRLKQTDLDGAYSYSSIKRVEIEGGYQLKAYPNPTTGKLLVTTGFGLEQQDIRLLNTIGQSVPVEFHQVGTEAEIEIKKVPAGIYILQVRRGFWQQSLRVVLH